MDRETKIPNWSVDAGNWVSQGKNLSATNWIKPN